MNKENEKSKATERIKTCLTKQEKRPANKTEIDIKIPSDFTNYLQSFDRTYNRFLTSNRLYTKQNTI